MSAADRRTPARGRRRPRARRAPLRAVPGVFAVVLLAALLAAGPTRAAVGIERFDGAVTRADGTPETQAGAHPFAMRTEIDFRRRTDGAGNVLPEEDVKTIDVALPAGFVGNPAQLPRCAELRFQQGTCADAAQVGVVAIELAGNGGGQFPVYNLDPQPGTPAQFGFQITGVPVRVDARVRSDDDGISVRIRNVSQVLPILSAALTMWGVPADARHDLQRGSCLSTDVNADGTTDEPGEDACPVSLPPAPFLTNPSDCSRGPLQTTLRADSWQAPDVWRSAAFTAHDAAQQPVRLGGCERLAFDPQLTFAPLAGAAPETPTGFRVDLTVPQDDDPDRLATAHVRRVAVTLPEGVVVSTPSADGLEGCTPEQAGLGTDAPPACPGASKIGTVELVTPLLGEPMHGGIFLAAPTPGRLLAMYLTAAGSGVVVKLYGTIDADPSTGRVTTTFADNPQLPFERLTLRFKDGPRAPLTTSLTCGTATTVATISSHAQPAIPVTATSSFLVSRDGRGTTCPPFGFRPSFTAGSSNPVAGRPTAFALTVGRDDGQQQLGRITAALPPGLLGRISSVALCDDGAASAGSCPAASQIGTVTVASGAGPAPLHLAGTVALTGPYGGGPFGLSIAVPARAGPFDLGTVVVRAAIVLDRSSARLTVVSDTLASILRGIPLKLRLADVRIDRPGFLLNPTSCRASAVGATVTSLGGAVAELASRFQVGDCAALPFRPRLGLAIGARGHTATDRTTPLTARLTMPGEQANVRAVRLTLPTAVNARLEAIARQACTVEQFRADRCPPQLRIGSAEARTPLLHGRLRGGAWFVRNATRRLPDLMVALRGQVAVDLVGRVSVARDGRLATAFDTVPDVPISSFTLRIAAGRNAPLSLTRDVCSPQVRRRLRAPLTIAAHSGRRVTRRQPIVVHGCGRGAAARRR